MLIAHATALTEADHRALGHAVALARRGGARLASVHASTANDEPVELEPASGWLARWGATASEVTHELVLHQCCDDVGDTLLDALRGLAPDLVVFATHARANVARLLFGSVAEGVARNLAVPSLLLPPNAHNLVDLETGRVRLDRVLVPAGSPEETQATLDAVARLRALTGAEQVGVHLIHVADGRPMPEPERRPGLFVSRHLLEGKLEYVVPAAARAFDVNLVAMSTRAHDGLGDVLLGSHTERILHALDRALLWVPLGQPH